MNNYIGIDVSKSTLQVFIPKNEIDVEVKNSSEGLKKLLNKLKKQYKNDIADIVFVYESTGSYSTLLEDFCQRKKIKCFKVGSYQSSSFSKTIKNRNKTDKVDARMLSSMHILVKEGDVKVPFRDERAHEIRSLIKYYRSLVKEKTRLKNYLEAAVYNLEDSYVLNKVKRKITLLKKEEDEIMDRVVKIIKANRDYLEAYENIMTIDGIGSKSAAVLLYFFLRYPDASRQHIVALCGLDPIRQESGTSLKKKAKISKQGITLVRGILFMPTLSAIENNSEMKHIFKRLVKRGKPSSLAQIAVMRKLILLAHSLYKSGQKYDSQRYLKHAQIKEAEVMI